MNDRAFARSFGAAGVVVLGILGLLLVTLGPPTAEGLGRFIGRMSIPAVFGAVVSGVIARRSTKPWPWWRYYATVAPVMIVVPLFANAGS